MTFKTALVPFALLTLAACSGSVETQPPGGDAGHGHDASGGGHDSSTGHDGGTSGDSGHHLPPPPVHRPTPVACSSTRPPGVEDASIPTGLPTSNCCKSDSDCPPSDAGTNGRCTWEDFGGPAQACPSCTYDQCTTDSQCDGGAICECGTAASAGRYPNVCVVGNCKVDSDCGPGGYCSPTNSCGPNPAYYCHTPEDECTSNAQCSSQPGTSCSWQSSSGGGSGGLWTCQLVACPV